MLMVDNLVEGEINGVKRVRYLIVFNCYCSCFFFFDSCVVRLSCEVLGVL